MGIEVGVAKGAAVWSGGFVSVAAGGMGVSDGSTGRVAETEQAESNSTTDKAKNSFFKADSC